MERHHYKILLVDDEADLLRLWRLRLESKPIKPACSASQDPLGVLFGWKSIQWFNSYSFLSKFKMAAAAILDFVTIFHSTKLAHWALQELLGVQIW